MFRWKGNIKFKKSVISFSVIIFAKTCRSRLYILILMIWQISKTHKKLSKILVLLPLKKTWYVKFCHYRVWFSTKYVTILNRLMFIINRAPIRAEKHVQSCIKIPSKPYKYFKLASFFFSPANYFLVLPEQPIWICMSFSL